MIDSPREHRFQTQGSFFSYRGRLYRGYRQEAGLNFRSRQRTSHTAAAFDRGVEQLGQEIGIRFGIVLPVRPFTIRELMIGCIKPTKGRNGGFETPRIEHIGEPKVEIPVVELVDRFLLLVIHRMEAFRVDEPFAAPVADFDRTLIRILDFDDAVIAGRYFVRIVPIDRFFIFRQVKMSCP